jgi:hypothetical protein
VAEVGSEGLTGGGGVELGFEAGGVIVSDYRGGRGR